MLSPANKVGEIDHPGYASTLLSGQVHCCIGYQCWYKVMVNTIPEWVVNQQQARCNGIDVPPCTVIQAVSSAKVDLLHSENSCQTCPSQM